MTKLITRLTIRRLKALEARFAALPLNQARASFEAASRVRWRQPVYKVDDIVIGADSLAARLYRNRQAMNKSTIIYFHGGGFVLGSVASHDAFCRLLAARTGCNVVSIGYPLAPEHPYPTAINDGLLAINWIKQHSVELEINASKLFLAGDSAGGQIALQIAAKYKNGPSGLILIYPALNPTIDESSMPLGPDAYYVTTDQMHMFWREYTNGSFQAGWPLDKQTIKDLPPTLILAAEYDILQKENQLFAGQLATASKAHKYICYKAMFHGFVQFPRIASKKYLLLRDIKSFIDSLGH